MAEGGFDVFRFSGVEGGCGGYVGCYGKELKIKDEYSVIIYF